MRKKKLLLNTYVALGYQLISIICGFIAPLFIIPYFGSAVNGMISSITQFLSIITLCECGVGAVVQSALYKPLAEKDDLQISKIISSSERFFKKILKIFFFYVVILVIIYPFILKNSYDFNYFYISAMILILASSYIAQYYLFLSYRLLLNADQLAYIQLFVHSCVLIINTILTIILIKLNVPVHIVKLIPAIIFFAQPFILKIYVDKHYKISIIKELDEEPIPQKWNGMAQHIANVVLTNTDTIVLTIFSTLENVSIYGVYYMIVYGVRQIIVSLSTGFQSLFGNMIAKKETSLLKDTFDDIEIVFNWIVTLLFTITAIMLVPFIKLYTINFVDINYVIPVFGIIMVIAQFLYSLRLPYELLMRAANKYKETQISSIVEALINIIISVLLVIILPNNLKMIGVAIGTSVAMAYRTLYLVYYFRNNVIFKKISSFLKNLIINLLSIALAIFVCSFLPKWSSTYEKLFLSMVINGIICLIITLIVNMIFYKKRFLKALKLFIK